MISIKESVEILVSIFSLTSLRKDKWRALVILGFILNVPIWYSIYYLFLNYNDIEQKINDRRFTRQESNYLIDIENEILFSTITECNNNQITKFDPTRGKFIFNCFASKAFINRINDTNFYELDIFKLLSCSFVKGKESNKLKRRCYNLLAQTTKEKPRISAQKLALLEAKTDMINNLTIEGCEVVKKSDLGGLLLLDVLDWTKELKADIVLIGICYDEGVTTILTQIRDHNAKATIHSNRMVGCSTKGCIEELYKGHIQTESLWR